MITQFANLAKRVLFVASFTLAGIAVVEKCANIFGYTVLRSTYEPGRVLEFSAIALLFVITLLLRDLQHASVSKGRT